MLPSAPVRRFTYGDVVVRKRGAIPHWHVPGGLYFVTYRLAHSVPQVIERRLTELSRQLEAARACDYADESTRLIERELFRLSDAELDRGLGACHLKEPRIGDLVMNSFDRDDGIRYERIALAIMPNHVHVVFRLLGTLDAVIQGWKSYTAHEANAVLGLRGAFWDPDYYDVLIRDSGQLERTVRYVLANPAKAGLSNWPWVKIWADRYAAL